MSTPFDPAHDDAIVECVRLASLDQLGRELARRAAAHLDQAEAAYQVARQGTDPLVVGPAAQMAETAAEWATRCAQATMAMLGTGDLATVQEANDHARAAWRCASNALAAWRRCKEDAGCAYA